MVDFSHLFFEKLEPLTKQSTFGIHSAGGSNFAPQPQPISLRACLAQEDGAWSLCPCGPTSAGRAIAPRNVVCPGCTNAGKDEGKGLWPASQKWDPKKYTKLVV